MILLHRKAGQNCFFSFPRKLQFLLYDDEVSLSFVRSFRQSVFLSDPRNQKLHRHRNKEGSPFYVFYFTNYPFHCVSSSPFSTDHHSLGCARVLYGSGRSSTSSNYDIFEKEFFYFNRASERREDFFSLYPSICFRLSGGTACSLTPKFPPPCSWQEGLSCTQSLLLLLLSTDVSLVFYGQLRSGTRRREDHNNSALQGLHNRLLLPPPPQLLDMTTSLPPTYRHSGPVVAGGADRPKLDPLLGLLRKEPTYTSSSSSRFLKIPSKKRVAPLPESRVYIGRAEDGGGQHRVARSLLCCTFVGPILLVLVRRRRALLHRRIQNRLEGGPPALASVPSP